MILVTGGAGFIGAAVVRALRAQGAPVRVFDDFSRGAARRLDGLAGVETVAGDICDAAALGRAARGAHTLIHLAAINGTEWFYQRPAAVLEVGIQGMLNVLAACRDNQVATLLAASSSEVYQTPAKIPTAEDAALSIPDPHNPRYSYAASKIATEMLTLHRRSGAPHKAIIVRPHNVYGPDMGEQHVIPQLVRRAVAAVAAQPTGVVPLELQGDGTQRRAFMHIDDFTAALLLVLARGENNCIYHLGNPEEYTIAALAEMIVAALGRTCRLCPSPAAAGGTMRRCPDISRLTALGFSPLIALPQGLESALRWYRHSADEAPEADSAR